MSQHASPHTLPALLTSASASRKILAECAVAEQLRRLPGIELHPTLFNTPLIYGPEAAQTALADIYKDYMNVAHQAELPLLLTAPTWRLDALRVGEANVPASINTDAVNFLLELRAAAPNATPLLIGALVGPQNDCYRPGLAPDADSAERFHAAQIDELAHTGADFLLAQTLPALSEAEGISRLLADSGKPYIISFCTGTDGRVLDGTPLPDAMAQLDGVCGEPPLGYAVNCTHPSYLLNAYVPGELDRLIGIQANGSSRDVTELDGASHTEADPIDTWAAAMLRLHTEHDVPILGGCCGTTREHMTALAGG